jgi:hypothetical protein
MANVIISIMLMTISPVDIKMAIVEANQDPGDNIEAGFWGSSMINMSGTIMKITAEAIPEYKESLARNITYVILARTE